MSTPRSVVGLLFRDGKICAVSRRNQPEDLGLPGGKIESGETPEDAIDREIREEVHVRVLKKHFVYERVDRTDGKIAWCYIIDEWEGDPCQSEDGIYVSWVTPQRLLEPSCTFREYNAGLFAHLGLA